MSDSKLESMSQSDKYRAFRNFMVNELGIGREDIRSWVLEAVRLEVSKLVGQINTEEIARLYIQYLVKQETGRFEIERHLREEIMKAFQGLYTIQILPKNESKEGSSS